MLGSLTRLLRKPDKLQSVSVVYVGADVFVATEYGTEGSDPCYVVGPVRKTSISADASVVGRVIADGLADCRCDFPAPQSREAWKSMEFPLLQSVGVKTWAALAKRSNSLTVRRKGTSVTVYPCRREKQGFFPIPEREFTLESPSNAELGERVIAELMLARSKEGPA